MSADGAGRGGAPKGTVAGVVAGHRHGTRAVVLAWCTAAAGLLLLQWRSSHQAVDWRRIDGRALAGWVQFDGPEYLAIATTGYDARQLVWFPVYPLLVRAVDGVLGTLHVAEDPRVAAVAVSLAGGLAAAVLLWRWLATQTLTPVARWTALAVALTYPYAWFLYGVVYSDAVYVALVLGAFVLAERDRWVWASLVGAVATATRPSGTAVVLGLLVLSLERHGVVSLRTDRDTWVERLRLPTRLDLRRLRPVVLAPLLALGGLVAYGAYLWVRWDNPLRWITEQENYHESGSATLLKRQYFEAWQGGFDGRHLATTTAQALLLLLVLLAVPAVGRRFGWGYGVLVLALAALPALSVSTFMGVGRYLIPAFPAFALVGEWLSTRPRLRAAWLVVSASLLVLMAFGFSRSWYLS